MNSSNRRLSAKKGAVFIGIAVAIAATAFIFLFTGFSLGGSRSSNPFGPGEGPPAIVMTAEGQEYRGKLLGYVFEERATISEIPDINIANITTVASSLSERTAELEDGSEIEFDTRGNEPSEARFDSLAVTVYDTEGSPVKLLDAHDGPPRNAYIIEGLESGNYVLIAIATWLPEDQGQITSGYVVYGYKIRI